MATIDQARPRRARLWAPDLFERMLALAAVALLLTALTALVRGRPHWGDANLPIWLHLGTILVALALTPVMLLRPRGDRLHRRLGWVWSAAMLLTAALSFLVRNSNHGRLSFIHLLSAYVLLMVPNLVLSARAHNVARHRRAVRGLVTGALLVAGFFTFPFGRMLGAWLFG